LEGDVIADPDSNATLIANDAVNSAKIADGSILGEDIADSTIPASKLVGSPTAGMILTTAAAGEAPTWLPGRSSYYSGNTVYKGNSVLLQPSLKIDLTKAHLISSGKGLLIAVTLYDGDIPYYAPSFFQSIASEFARLKPWNCQAAWYLNDWNMLDKNVGLLEAPYREQHRLFVLHAFTDCVIDENVQIGPY
jgi:hypothetical protein